MDLDLLRGLEEVALQVGGEEQEQVGDQSSERHDQRQGFQQIAFHEQYEQPQPRLHDAASLHLPRVSTAKNSAYAESKNAKRLTRLSFLGLGTCGGFWRRALDFRKALFTGSTYLIEMIITTIQGEHVR